MPSHGENRGSIPLGSANRNIGLDKVNPLASGDVQYLRTN
jgi:hypothetical protein